jgi:succinate dehydrogenase/fumarate reductase flavoprotein subunit
MKLQDMKTVICDVLIVGGGGAGLRAAIEAKEMGADVLIASKTRVGYGNNTFISKAAFAATGWGDPEDNQSLHLKDTIIGGRFINDQNLVAAMTREVGTEVNFLEKSGVRLRKREGNILINPTPGHRYPRGIGAEKPVGSELILPLKERAQRIGIRFTDRVFITKLFLRGNRIAGATGVDNEGYFLSISAGSVILATGGYAQAYRNTDNAPGITGDGLALAFDCGIRLKDVEFVQFYPTAMGRLGKRILLYEAFISRAGAVLKNARGENIIEKHGLTDPKIMTRDRLARSISEEIFQGSGLNEGVILDISPVQEDNLKRFRSLLPLQWTADQKEFIVSPTTHFCMGGVIINEQAETSIAGLFAAGEVCAGIHGANRLGGNALAEVFAMGGIAGRNAVKAAQEGGRPNMSGGEITDERARLEYSPSQPGEDIKKLSHSLKELMWLQAGIIRNGNGLDDALSRITELRSLSQNSPRTNVGELKRYLELQNMLLMSEIICRGALLRTESRGAHYRSDFPEEDNINWLKNIVVSQDSGQMILKSIPVSPDVVPLEDVEQLR